MTTTVRRAWRNVQFAALAAALILNSALLLDVVPRVDLRVRLLSALAALVSAIGLCLLERDRQHATLTGTTDE